MTSRDPQEAAGIFDMVLSDSWVLVPFQRRDRTDIIKKSPPLFKQATDFKRVLIAWLSFHAGW
jgi:hypothetical protein